MAIIGIVGKMGIGKDTVGKIIQYLTFINDNKENEYYYPITSFIQNLKNNKDVISEDFETQWQIKKFADKLKDIVCLLIGCTREQLEDEVFKNTELVEEWWYFKGRNSSLISYNEDSKRSDEDLIKLTPRLLLQLLGTECGRDVIHPNIWVNSLMSEYKTKSILINEVNYLGDSRCSICKKPTKDISYFLCDEHIEKSKNNFPNWIITDTRFPNEAKAIKDRNGILIRVERDIIQRTGHVIPNEVDLHSSEVSLDNYKEFDYTIDNNGTIEELIEKVKEILIEEKII